MALYLKDGEPYPEAALHAIVVAELDAIYPERYSATLGRVAPYGQGMLAATPSLIPLVAKKWELALILDGELYRTPDPFPDVTETKRKKKNK